MTRTGVTRLMAAESILDRRAGVDRRGRSPFDLVLILRHPSAASAAGAGDRIAARGRANPRSRRWP